VWIKRKSKEASAISLSFAKKEMTYPPSNAIVSQIFEDSIANKIVSKNFAEIQKNLLDANASKVDLSIDETSKSYIISLKNDGIPFPAKMIPENNFEPKSYKEILEKGRKKIISDKKVGQDFGGAGRGLAGMYLELKKYGGDLLIQNNRGGGTTLTIIGPKRSLRLDDAPKQENFKQIQILSTTAAISTLLPSPNSPSQSIEAAEDYLDEAEEEFILPALKKFQLDIDSPVQNQSDQAEIQSDTISAPRIKGR
jgi:hypothetical protein